MQVKKQRELRQTAQKTGKRLLLTGVLIVLLSGCGQEETKLFLEENLTIAEEEENSAEEAKQAEEKENRAKADEGEVPETDETMGTGCFVHVCGAVKNPGVYELPEGSRIFEAVEAAGGLTEEACSEYQNQAQKITDGMKIFIPTTEQADNGDAKKYFLQEEAALTDGTKEQDGRININTADKELLMTLPGIGESKAEGIISYRETNGSFAKTEDIMQISGIKEGAYEKIKDKICIN